MNPINNTKTNILPTKDNENFGVAASLPRLAMFNSMAGFGHISTTVSLPVISALQVQVCPIPTAVLSNHLAFPTCSFIDYTPYMQDYLRAWKELKLTFDGLYCGYLGNVKQLDMVKEFLNEFRPSHFLLDPVMGDSGKAYSTITPEYYERMKTLLSHADILTPNITEACLLTDTPYKDKEWTEQELQLLCLKLSELCPGHIVITGLQKDNTFTNYIRESNGTCTSCSFTSAGKARHGTGDLFASILAANMLRGKEIIASVKQAADFVALCIRGSEEMELPVSWGVPFEKYLHCLINDSDPEH